MKKLLLTSCVAMCVLSEVEAQNVGVNTTGAAPAATNLFEVLQPSTTANTVSVYSRHSGAVGSGTAYGLQAISNGAGVNNVAAYLQAVNGTSSNYALIVPSGGGNVGIGTASPGSLLEVNGGYISNINDANNSLILTYSYNAVAASTTAHFIGLRARGTSSSPTHPLTNDAIAAFQGRNAAAANSWSGMSVFAAENHTAAAQGSYLRFYTVPNGTITPTDRMTILNSGNVGIGTTAPTTQLEVNGSINAGITGKTSASLFTSIREVSSVEQRSQFWTDVNGRASVASLDNDLVLTANYNASGTPDLFIQSADGNVGIGTNNPAMHLQVGSGLGLTWGNNNVLGMNQYYDNVDARYESLGSGYSFMLWQDKTNGTVRFGVNNNNATGANEAVSHSYALNILANTNVGINTITPKGALSVVRASLTDGLINLADNETDATNKYATMVLRHYTNSEEPVLLIGGQSFSGTSDVLIGGNFSTANAATSIKFYTAANNTTTSGTVRATIDGNGNVGIGIVSSSAQLHTTGTVRFANFGAGTMQTDASGNVSVSSDARLKNIKSDFVRGLDAIQGLTPKTYKWNAISGLDTKEEYTGFIAQNVQEFIPEARGTDSRGYLTLSDRPIIAALVNAVKDLSAISEEQQQVIDSQQAEINTLKTLNTLKVEKQDFEDLKKSNEILKAEISEIKAILNQNSKK